MTAAAKLQPFAVLQDIETRSRTKAFGLPQQEEVRQPWSGIGFRLGGRYMVSALGTVNEILTYPEMTRVPGARPWVMGIANIRGSLMPILDLNGFIEGSMTEIQRRSRVLVIEQDDVAAGLLVDEALGLRHFFEEERNDDLPEVSDTLQMFLEGGYRKGETYWGVFNMKNLVEHPRFFEIAAHA